jgi:hypothetical protein
VNSGRLIGVLLGLSLAPAAARADGFQVSPGLTLAESYDDDLAPGGSGPASAFFTVASPTVALGYAGQRFTLLAHGALDAEALDKAPFRHTPFLRLASDANLTWLATERLTLTANGTFWDTNTPRDVNVVTGFNPHGAQVAGSERAWSTSGEAGLSYAFSERARGAIDGSIVTTTEGGLTIKEETARTSFHRQLGPTSGGRFDLLYRRIDFSGTSTISGGASNAGVNIEAPMLGWDQRLSPRLTFEVLAGPRFDKRFIEGIEASASLVLQLQAVQVSASLASTQTSVAGFYGTVDTESASVTAMVRADEHLFLSATPAFYASAGQPLHSKVFELRLQAERTLGENMALVASYRISAQNATFADAALNAGASTHNQVVLGISFHSAGSHAVPFAWPMAGAWAGRAGSPPAPIEQQNTSEQTLGIPSTVGVPIPQTQSPPPGAPATNLPDPTQPSQTDPPVPGTEGRRNP